MRRFYMTKRIKIALLFIPLFFLSGCNSQKESDDKRTEYIKSRINSLCKTYRAVNLADVDTLHTTLDYQNKMPGNNIAVFANVKDIFRIDSIIYFEFTVEDVFPPRDIYVKDNPLMNRSLLDEYLYVFQVDSVSPFGGLHCSFLHSETLSW
jgi:hypothetical protein